MEHQQQIGENRTKYLVSSIEQGINMIINNARIALLGGRETLFFNMKQRGIDNFQLSEKLYTRYSAIAVQSGCPYIESLNNVLVDILQIFTLIHNFS